MSGLICLYQPVRYEGAAGHMCLSGAKKVLTDAGHDTLWVGDFLHDPGDKAILNLAYKENRVLVTLDKDFGELAVVKGMLHRGIIRIVGHSALEQGPVCVQILQKYSEDLKKNALITVDKNKTRIRPGDS